jgi:hypothetical protein
MMFIFSLFEKGSDQYLFCRYIFSDLDLDTGIQREKIKNIFSDIQNKLVYCYLVFSSLRKFPEPETITYKKFIIL